MLSQQQATVWFHVIYATIRLRNPLPLASLPKLRFPSMFKLISLLFYPNTINNILLFHKILFLYSIFWTAQYANMTSERLVCVWKAIVCEPTDELGERKLVRLRCKLLQSPYKILLLYTFPKYKIK